MGAGSKACVRLVLSAAVLLAAVVDARAEQTIVFFRHAEKPVGGYGQLTCQGLNRALALPAVLAGKFGTPTYLYAPDPHFKVSDAAGLFYYVRPLATIEPAAIRLRMNVWTRYAFSDITGLQQSLVTPTKDNTTSFVAWEHVYLQRIVQNIMNAYGGGVAVPAWPDADYDSLYVVRISYGSPIVATFTRDVEGLNGQATTCP